MLILHAGKLFIYLSAPDSWGGISYTLPPQALLWGGNCRPCQIGVAAYDHNSTPEKLDETRTEKPVADPGFSGWEYRQHGPRQ